MTGVLRSLWSEPRPPLPEQRRSALDVVLAILCAAIAIVEGLVRDDVPARPVAVACALVVAALIAFRRAHPFAAFSIAFGLAVGADLVAFAAGVPLQGLYVTAAILLLPYSLFRWGAGREALVGVVVMAAVYASSLATGEMKDAGEAIGAAVVMALPAALGASVRFRAQAQRRALDAVRALERERLARDLHDTVAHHVSAIAIQAQAARVVVATKPEAAERALDAIEAEAKRALTELRSLVGILRDGDAPLAPQHGLADVERLARDVVQISLTGDLVGLRPGLEAAVFRIAQEGVTNASRHARDASRISVHVHGERDCVRVRVDDDGRAPSRTTGGFGLTGMAERAALLGGTFQAGPRAEGGWRVEAVFPREEPT